MRKQGCYLLKERNWRKRPICARGSQLEAVAWRWLARIELKLSFLARSLGVVVEFGAARMTGAQTSGALAKLSLKKNNLRLDN